MDCFVANRRAPRNDLFESVIASLRSNPCKQVNYSRTKQRLRCEKRYEAEGGVMGRGLSSKLSEATPKNNTIR